MDMRRNYHYYALRLPATCLFIDLNARALRFLLRTLRFALIQTAPAGAEAGLHDIRKRVD